MSHANRAPLGLPRARCSREISPSISFLLLWLVLLHATAAWGLAAPVKFDQMTPNPAFFKLESVSSFERMGPLFVYRYKPARTPSWNLTSGRTISWEFVSQTRGRNQHPELECVRWGWGCATDEEQWTSIDAISLAVDNATIPQSAAIKKDLLLALMLTIAKAESGFNYRARTPFLAGTGQRQSSACGLCQIIRATGLRVGLPPDRCEDPYANARSCVLLLISYFQEHPTVRATVQKILQAHRQSIKVRGRGGKITRALLPPAKQLSLGEVSELQLAELTLVTYVPHHDGPGARPDTITEVVEGSEVIPNDLLELTSVGEEQVRRYTIFGSEIARAVGTRYGQEANKIARFIRSQSTATEALRPNAGICQVGTGTSEQGN